MIGQKTGQKRMAECRPLVQLFFQTSWIFCRRKQGQLRANQAPDPGFERTIVFIAVLYTRYRSQNAAILPGTRDMAPYGKNDVL
jgi:hypothetical protein